MLFPRTTPTIDLTLHTSKKSDLPSKAWQAYFMGLLLLYPTRTPVFCDGSKTAEQTAAGSWSTDFNLMAGLNKSNSIFTAELFAIFITLKYLESKNGLFILVSDSLSSLKALQHAHPKSHYLFLKITHLLAVTPNKFILAWVPSHMGMEGNELADKIAQEALLLPHAVLITLSDQELKQIISTHYHSQWQHQ
jgi:kelch-like protein 2/3